MSIKESLASEMEAADKMKEALAKRKLATEEREKARLEKYNRMAEEVEHRRARHQAEANGEDPDLVVKPAALTANQPEPIVEEEETDTTTSQSQEEEPEEQIDYSKKVTRTVNGVKITKSLADWMLLAEASEQQPVYSRPAPAIDLPELDDEQLAKDISLGDPESATAAIKTLRQSVVDATTRALTNEQLKLTGQQIWSNFLKEYPDIASDKMLTDMVIKIDSDLLQDGKSYGPDAATAFHKRVRVAGEQVRQWRDGFASLNKKQDLLEKKKGIRTLSNINTKQTVQEEKQLSEKEARDLAVREMMERRRRRG